MRETLERRIGTPRNLHMGERVVLSLAVAAGDVGRHIEAVLSRHGLDSRRYAILRMLRTARDEGLRHGEIAERMLVGNPDVTRLAGRLEESGWILKQPDESDRRVVRHRITTAGLQKLDELEGPLTHVFDRIVTALGPATAEEVVRVCQRAIEAGASMASEGAVL